MILRFTVILLCLVLGACTTSQTLKVASASSGYVGKGYSAVKSAASKYGVNVRFALAVAKAESGGRCGATSSAGAKGVMQVMPATGRKHGVRRSKSLYNCQIGASAGVRELKYCLRISKGNRVKALSCYNGGPAWVISKRYKGRRLPAETRNYIYKILGVRVERIT